VFRTTNPSNQFLHGSTCYFDVKSTRIVDDCEGTRLYRELKERGGRLERNSDGNCVLTVPHDQCDAFGGLYLLNQFLRDDEQQVSHDVGFERQGTIHCASREYSFESVQKPFFPSRRPEVGASRTFLQTFVLAMVEAGCAKNFESIAFPVCHDDLQQITDGNVWGNSLSIITISVDEVVRLAQGSKDGWKNVLMEKADRVRQILAKRSKLRPLEDNLLISSLGNLNRLRWTDRLDSSLVTMVPTPIGARSQNLVLWATDTTQTLSLCADSVDIAASNLFSSIRSVWEAVIYEN